MLRQNRNGRACGAAAVAALDRLDRLCDDGSLCSAAQTRTPRSAGKARFGHGEAFRALSAVGSLGCGTIAQGCGDSPFGSPRPAGGSLFGGGTALLSAYLHSPPVAQAAASRVGRACPQLFSLLGRLGHRPVLALRPLSAARRGCVRRRAFLPPADARPPAGLHLRVSRVTCLQQMSEGSCRERCLSLVDRDGSVARVSGREFKGSGFNS